MAGTRIGCRVIPVRCPRQEREVGEHDGVAQPVFRRRAERRERSAVAGGARLHCAVDDLEHTYGARLIHRSRLGVLPRLADGDQCATDGHRMSEVLPLTRGR